MHDRGIFLTWAAVRRQLAALPHPIYLVRLIHQPTRRAFPCERLWTASELTSMRVIAFLRMRKRDGCNIYLQPYAHNRNPGYILLDLDRADPTVVQTMQAQGHEPCLVLQTSPGHLQAWLHLSHSPLEPSLATAVARQLARTHGGDLASAHWRHLGRLAGFTNQKPERRQPSGYQPWVKILLARAGLASRADELLHSAAQALAALPGPAPALAHPQAGQEDGAPPPISRVEATQIYQDCVRRWRICERFRPPDWSIVDLWVARQLLSQQTPADQVQAILRLASPHFPRRHGNPEDYLRRTLARAALPRPARPVCTPAVNAATPSPSIGAGAEFAGRLSPGNPCAPHPFTGKAAPLRTRPSHSHDCIGSPAP
jgi:hypothetical protein